MKQELIHNQDPEQIKNITQQAIINRTKTNQILNKDAAKTFLIRSLEKRGFQIQMVKPMNKGRHILFKTQSQNFYLLYKKEPLHSFNHLHKHYANQPNTFKGYGETINKECLEYAIRKNCLLLYIYESDPFSNNGNKIYWVHPKQVKDFCTKNNLIRVHEKPTTEQIPNSQSMQTFNEVTFDFPISFLHRFNN